MFREELDIIQQLEREVKETRLSIQRGVWSSMQSSLKRRSHRD